MLGPKWLVLTALILSGLLLTAAAVSPGGTPQLARSVIGGGGGAMQNGSITLQGTTGQPVAGLAAGGNSALCSGFWCLPPPVAESDELYLPVITWAEDS